MRFFANLTAAALLACITTPLAPAQEPADVTIRSKSDSSSPEQHRIFRRIGSPRKEKAAFLGVSTSPATPALREQVKLPRGIGLVVDAVEPDSPADAAGLKQHDLLHKLNDQILINTQQLRVLLRTFKPADEVKLTLVRQGQSQVLSAKLVEKELPALDADNLFLDFQPEGLRDFLLEKLPHGNTLLTAPGNGAVSVSVTGNRSEAAWSDNEHTLRLSSKDGKDHLIVTDKAGNTIFAGPIETQEQRLALPDDIADKLAKMEKSAQVEIRTFQLTPTTRPVIRFRTIRKEPAD
jgi:hypothetical protein